MSRITRRHFLPASAAAFAAPAAAAASVRYPVLDRVDVLVAGGGAAGIGAALGAARAGARTLLVENHSFFGGVAAWALGMQMNQMRPEGQARSAIHELLIEKLAAYGDQAVRLGKHEVWTNVEYLKVAILDALEAAGAQYLLHVRVAGAVVESGRVTGAVVATKRGLMTIEARVVVDATGDADVAHYSGAATLMEESGLMPMTLALALTNIDHATTRPADAVAALRAGRKKYPRLTSGFFEIKPIANSQSWWVNHAGTSDLGRIDPTDPVARTRAEAASRRQALDMVRALRESGDPRLARIEWIGAGPQVSVRESRRVKGVYVLTEEDATTGRAFDDAIAWRSGFLDPGGQAGTRMARMKIHDVPYRALLPEKMDGLLTAGRCISATHLGAAAGKSMGNCMATGHAAGVAAALSARANRTPRELDVKKLREHLRRDGVNFDLHDRDQRGLPL